MNMFPDLDTFNLAGSTIIPKIFALLRQIYDRPGVKVRKKNYARTWRP
jgi:hypothetical protein